MNQRDRLCSLSKKPLPIDSSSYEYNCQSFRQNPSSTFNFSQSANSSSSSNFSSSSLYNQFISDLPLNGSLRNDNELNSRFNSNSINKSRNGLTFFDKESYFNEKFEQQQSFFNENENFNEQTSEYSSEAAIYDDIALQAQHLLDKINFDFQDHSASTLNSSTSYNISNLKSNHSFINHGISQSSPSLQLQPILHNTDFFKNHTNDNISPNQNQKNFKPPTTTLRNLNQYQQSNFRSSYNLPNSNQFRHNNPQRVTLKQNQGDEIELSQYQKPPQATFVSPDYLLSSNFEPNMKRLNTASEMVYPDNHIELLQHSYES